MDKIADLNKIIETIDALPHNEVAAWYATVKSAKLDDIAAEDLQLLTAEIATLKAEIATLKTERDKYRSALERIRADANGCGHCDMKSDIARTTLEGK